MNDTIATAIEELLDLTIGLQTRISQTYADLTDYTLSQSLASLVRLSSHLEEFISLAAELELSEDDAKMCKQTISSSASTLKDASQEIQSLVDELQAIV
ncbi:transporter [Escherichia coli]|uniref:Transporter n=1 Tax=Escherichia coli TaxID=562 RepID=A0A7A7A4Q3_ECOLX|nr:transporter [Escherichia coli]EHC9919329.1 transporter [Escherichia coli]EII6458646.1 transporter [Escherichia coli]ELH8647883.1 transporter [Escherichia coli]MBI9889023.1 transporter [Escherichia coli]